MDNNNEYHALYRSAVAVAKELGIDPAAVPMPFRLNELERFYFEKSEELKRRRDEADEAKRYAKEERPKVK